MIINLESFVEFWREKIYVAVTYWGAAKSVIFRSWLFALWRPKLDILSIVHWLMPKSASCGVLLGSTGGAADWARGGVHSLRRGFLLRCFCWKLQWFLDGFNAVLATSVGESLILTIETWFDGMSWPIGQQSVGLSPSCDTCVLIKQDT